MAVEKNVGIGRSLEGDDSAERDARQTQVATYVARMEISDPDVLRATRAHCAFRGCAQALRPEHGGNLYHESFVSEKISCFWSHSWHGFLGAYSGSSRERRKAAFWVCATLMRR
eukprot:g22596.t1